MDLVRAVAGGRAGAGAKPPRSGRLTSPAIDHAISKFASAGARDIKAIYVAAVRKSQFGTPMYTKKFFKNNCLYAKVSSNYFVNICFY